ncbi:MAG: hypothetical protein GC160_20205 [Acidobacteria bacterium]|nr:hypothetical protein [Acidobacteriota bacterium]
MRPCRPALLLLALASAFSASAYIRSTATGTVDGPPLFRTDFEAVQFYVQDIVAPGLANADGRPLIAPGSDPLPALQAALDAWGSIETSALRFLPLETTPAGYDTTDGLNVMVFEDTAATRSLTGGATAVTALRFEPNGRIVESDIVFNPNYKPGNNQIPFSTDLSLNSVDLQATATYHVGKSIGANVSGVIGAAMFDHTEQSQSFGRNLTSDDRALAADVYPAPDMAGDFGVIFGAITIENEPATGVLVTAIEPARGYVQTTLTSVADGTYRMRVPAVPSSRYYIYVESLDGPLLPSQVQFLNLSGFRTDLRPRFFGSSAAPIRVDALPGREVRIDIRAEGGPSALEISQIGIDVPGGVGRPLRLSDGPIRLTAGQAHDIVVAGLGIDSTIGIDGIRVLGPGLTVRPGSIRVDPEFTVGGGPLLRVTVDVAPRSDARIGTFAIVAPRAADFFTGALLIEPEKPQISSGGVVNAASFAAQPVAPGALFSLFGKGLGPVQGVAIDGFDPETGLLPTTLGGVTVSFDGVAAPLIFVSDGQVNLQVPLEVASRANSVVRVNVSGLESEPLTVPVAATAPGLFQTGTTQAAALNTDGSINGPANPAGRLGFVILYATGQGLVAPPIATGAAASGNPLQLAEGVRVTIGGLEVPADDILFAGLAPGFVGLLQVNIRLRDVYPAGDAVPVVLELQGRPSQTATIALQ